MPSGAARLPKVWAGRFTHAPSEAGAAMVGPGDVGLDPAVRAALDALEVGRRQCPARTPRTPREDRQPGRLMHASFMKPGTMVI